MACEGEEVHLEGTEEGSSSLDEQESTWASWEVQLVPGAGRNLEVEVHKDPCGGRGHQMVPMEALEEESHPASCPPQVVSFD